MTDFFSNIENGKKELVSEEINYRVYNAVITIFENYNIHFAKNFPKHCIHGNITGTDRQKLASLLLGLIPELGDGIGRIYDEYEVPDKYAILDFVQFCYDKIWDCEFIEYEYNHEHYGIPGTRQQREQFRNEINQVFERNGIVFYLDSDGSIKRHLPRVIVEVIENFEIKTSDYELNEMLKFAVENIRKPKESDRKFALDKLWDSYERMKTFFSELKKKGSLEKMLKEVAHNDNDFYLLLDKECRALTDIGNEFFIRHYETDKIPIKSVEHIDYLFFRMFSLINLCIKKLNA